MVRILYIFLIFIIASCASHKRSDKELLVSESLDISKSLNMKKKTSISEIDWESIHEWSEWEFVFKKYDTTKQPDPLGNYPLKDEGTLKGSNNRKRETNKLKDTDIEESETQKTQSTGSLNVKGFENIEQSTEVASPFNLNWLWLLLFLLPIGFFIKKFIFNK